MCSEKGYAHTEQGKEGRRKKGYTGLCSFKETSILLIRFLSFLSLFIYLFLFVLCIHVDCISIFWYKFVWMCLHICVYQRITSFLSIHRVTGYCLPFFFSVVCNLPSRLGWLASSPWIYLHSTGSRSLYHHV